MSNEDRLKLIVEVLSFLIADIAVTIGDDRAADLLDLLEAAS